MCDFKINDFDIIAGDFSDFFNIANCLFSFKLILTKTKTNLKLTVF